MFNGLLFFPITPYRSDGRGVDAALPQVIGLTDGAGDFDRMSLIVRAVRDAGTSGSFHFFFNGMPTAEVTQRAYRAIGVPLYSSATLAFAPRAAVPERQGAVR